MMLTKRQVGKLNKVMAMVQGLLDQAEARKKLNEKAARAAGGGRVKPKGTRRRAGEVAQMRADVLKKRKQGVPATELAKKYGVSTAYIYMIKS